MKRLFLLLLIVAMLVCPVMADSSTVTSVQSANSYSVSPPSGIVIYEIVVGDLPMGTNQTHVLMYKGNPYIVNINTWDDWGWKNAQVSVTDPNGSVTTQHVSVVAGVTDSYITTIQPSFIKSESASLAVTLSVGITPMTAQMGALALSTDSATALPFSTAAGSFTNGQRTSISIYEIPLSDFTKSITDYNPVSGLTTLGSQVFQWTWDTFKGFLNQIPVIGPLLITFIDFAGTIGTTLIFWLSFILLNLPAIVLSVETLIIFMAIINAGNGPSAYGRLGKNLLNYNVRFVTGILWIFDYTRVLLVSLVEMIATVIRALNPL